ncbi:MAG: (2Fe-2S)-binding protein [Bauldia sp.]|nr:(2Fe-2S)-binding protein [Bauldia sp.]
MIVCSCNVLTEARVIAAAEALGTAEPARPVTAGRIFRALGTRPQCGTCLSLIRRISAEAGATVSCPEPLATVAEDRRDLTLVEIDIVFDVAERVT